ncbi:hypothetical protein STCU_05570 [Strigomonas culicis]|nr:hypothetical protein STCU_05570 [Strigomonas culicis]|eukprot:EPY27768.1 hypothetical protein STCU_05570 [Strigomonas culicis]
MLRQGWVGVSWDDDDGIVVPIADDPVLLLEVASVTKKGNKCLGIGVLHTQAMLCEDRQYAKMCVHMLPTAAAIDSTTVHIVAEVEVHSNLLDEPPENNYIPLEYNYGSVRVSTLDFYYPSFFLSSTGQYIISNVVCAMNMTESSSLAMQLLPRGLAASYVQTNPPQVITVRPQQRVYFSGTWLLSQAACMRSMELQLTVNGSQRPTAPIIIHVHNSVPQPASSDLPYHYWVNTTCVTNRAMMPSQELPLIKTILPVHRLIGNGPVDQTEGMIVAFDKDKGEQVLVQANGLPVEMGDRPSHNTLDVTSMADLLSSAVAFNTNASFVVSDRSAFASPARGPLLDLSQKTCLCTIVLGTIRGFPMVYETSTGVSPSFQVSLTLLDQTGWQLERGETLPSYQSASGSLRWTEELVLRKWPGAQSTQFVRLNLTEVRARDGDETPIGCGLISLRSMKRTYIHSSLSVAFFVYETYSLYDQLGSPSLLMKDVNVVFSQMR